MKEVVVVATYWARPGKGPELEGALLSAVPPSHQEPGCILYALHRGLDDPDVLIFVERWQSADHLRHHATQPWVMGLMEYRALMEREPVVNVLEAVTAGDPRKGSLASS